MTHYIVVRIETTLHRGIVTDWHSVHGRDEQSATAVCDDANFVNRNTQVCYRVVAFPME